MFQPTQRLIIACLLLGAMFAPATAAEREDVRKAINLVTSVKMPYPENLRAQPGEDGARVARTRRRNHRLHQARGSSLVL